MPASAAPRGIPEGTPPHAMAERGGGKPKPLVRTRLVAAQQRLAFGGLLVDRLAQVAVVQPYQDLLERVADALPPITTHDALMEYVRNHDVAAVRALLGSQAASFIVPGDVVLEAAALDDDSGGSRVHLVRALLKFQTTLHSVDVLQLLAEATANGDVHVVRDIVNHIVSGRPTEAARRFVPPFETFLLADKLGRAESVHIVRELDKLVTHAYGPVPPSG